MRAEKVFFTPSGQELVFLIESVHGMKKVPYSSSVENCRGQMRLILSVLADYFVQFEDLTLHFECRAIFLFLNREAGPSHPVGKWKIPKCTKIRAGMQINFSAIFF